MDSAVCPGVSSAFSRLRVDDRRDVRLLVRDQIGRVREAIEMELFEDHVITTPSMGTFRIVTAFLDAAIILPKRRKRPASGRRTEGRRITLLCADIGVISRTATRSTGSASSEGWS
jgi:hypothetical protein